MPIHKVDQLLGQLDIGAASISKAYLGSDLVFDKAVVPTPDLFTVLWGRTTTNHATSFGTTFDCGAAAEGRYLVIPAWTDYGTTATAKFTLTDGSTTIKAGFVRRWIGFNTNVNALHMLQTLQVIPIPDLWSGTLTVGVEAAVQRTWTHYGILVTGSYLEEIKAKRDDALVTTSLASPLKTIRRNKLLSSVLMLTQTINDTNNPFADNTSIVGTVRNIAAINANNRVKQCVGQRAAPNDATVSTLAATATTMQKSIVTAAFSDTARKVEDRLPFEAENPVYWFRADHGALNAAGNPCSDGDRVATWVNYGSFAQNATASNGPIYRTGGLGGRPYLEFDGTSEYFNDLTGLPMPGAIANWNPWLTHIGVIELASGSGFSPILAKSSNQNSKVRLDFNQTAGTMNMGKTQFVRTDAAISSGPFKFIITVDGTCALRSYVNDTYAVLSNCTNDSGDTVTDVQFFHSTAFTPERFFSGKVYEFMSLPRDSTAIGTVLSDENRHGVQRVHNYLDQRYELNAYHP